MSAISPNSTKQTRSALSTNPYSIPFVEYDLDNGLHVILCQTGTVPLVVVNLWYHVGSKDEDPRRTGFAHLFEHMMFQGSANVAKDGHFKYIQSVGGSLNATTSVDRTNYFETLPSSSLELGLWLESDRMLALNVTEENFENQRAVVKEERRQRYENQPYGRTWENIVPSLFPTSGYHWTTIGSMQHLDDATIDDVRNFHSTYYHPNNCSLALSGAFDEAEARRLIEKYFGSIPRGPAIQRTPQPIAPVTQEVRLTTKDAVKLPAVWIAFQAPTAFSADDESLVLLAEMLSSGRSSRLYRSLVYVQKIARDVEAFAYLNEGAGAFVFSAKVQPSSSIAEVEAALWLEIEKIRSAAPSKNEIEKVRNSAQTHLGVARGELGKRADAVQRAYTFTGDASRVNRELERYSAVTADDVHRVARTYLERERSVVLHVIPEVVS
jgi:predicted Zn-dependent peptidase